MATQQQSFVDRRKGDTWINVLIGAVIALFLPTLGHLIGGAVAGYLQNTTRMDGAKVGAIATVLASIPLALVGLVFAGFGIFAAVAGEAAGGLVFILIVLVIFVLGLLTAGVVGGVGGYVGAMLAEN